MKIPLRFQITEFDCGTVALQNAISYLYDRENVPAEFTYGKRRLIWTII